MRKLIYVPTLHSEGERVADLKEFASRHLKDSSEDLQIIDLHVERIWSLIERGSEALPRDLRGVRIFSEGVTEGNVAVLGFFGEQIQALPVESQVYFESMLLSPTEKDLIYLKQSGLEGRNLRLVVRLMLRGAEVEVTEGNYFEEALKLTDEAIRFLDGNKESEYMRSDLSNKLSVNLSNRDRDIAKRVNTRLINGETGILILGQEHRPLGLLDKDIQVEFIDPELIDAFAEFRSELGKRDSERQSSNLSETKG